MEKTGGLNIKNDFDKDSFTCEPDFQEMKESRLENLSYLDQQMPMIRDQVRQLSLIKVKEAQQNLMMNIQGHLLENASLTKLTKKDAPKEKGSIESIKERMFDKVPSQPKLSDMYPTLMNELNDCKSHVPAYQRFQKKDSILRDDIKEVKASHFKEKYHQELQKPKKAMANVQFRNQSCTGTNYYEMKYFLTDKQKMQNIKENQRQNFKDIVEKESTQVKKSRIENLLLAKTIPQNDRKSNEQQIQNNYDSLYQDGQIVYADMGPVLPSTRVKLIKENILKGDSELALKYKLNKLVVSSAKVQEFDKKIQFQNIKVSAVMPKSSYKKSQVERLQYITENQRLMNSQVKQKTQFQNQIGQIREISQSRLGSLNLKIPESILNQVHKVKREEQIKKYLHTHSFGMKSCNMTEASRAVIDRKIKALQHLKQQSRIFEQTVADIDNFEKFNNLPSLYQKSGFDDSKSSFKRNDNIAQSTMSNYQSTPFGTQEPLRSKSTFKEKYDSLIQDDSQVLRMRQKLNQKKMQLNLLTKH